MPFPCILGGFETPKNIFFLQIFAVKEQKEDRGKSEISPKNRDKLPKFGIIEYRWSISYRSPPITEISSIFWLKFQKFCSLVPAKGIELISLKVAIKETTMYKKMHQNQVLGNY